MSLLPAILQGKHSNLFYEPKNQGPGKVHLTKLSDKCSQDSKMSALLQKLCYFQYFQGFLNSKYPLTIVFFISELYFLRQF